MSNNRFPKLDAQYLMRMGKMDGYVSDDPRILEDARGDKSLREAFRDFDYDAIVDPKYLRFPE